MSDVWGRAVRDLVVQWEFLRHVPSQALEAVHAAEQVRLSDAAAAAAVSHVDAIARDVRSGRRGRRPNKAVEIYFRKLAFILRGYVEVRRVERTGIGGPEDGFKVYLPTGQAKRKRLAAKLKAELDRMEAKSKGQIKPEEQRGDWES